MEGQIIAERLDPGSRSRTSLKCNCAARDQRKVGNCVGDECPGNAKDSIRNDIDTGRSQEPRSEELSASWRNLHEREMGTKPASPGAPGVCNSLGPISSSQCQADWPRHRKTSRRELRPSTVLQTVGDVWNVAAVRRSPSAAAGTVADLRHRSAAGMQRRSSGRQETERPVQVRVQVQVRKSGF